ncbi:hypothetical protein AGDE_09400 [Angomonas deanei]|uniref:Uncharacterized protein n=1 Tax=Angomonas deanei TaxID=59799 RepID=A0A7G2CP57_9TRYP|nr:hypothetical protein AGDE_09400 [Angomonas deanei]CAD2220731.1 Protein of unknown function (DUF229), putative [Angomonas deanei]|eukprot:EPY30524.1 hypothetical protein AGDE_09400 [Angomonas deanei]
MIFPITLFILLDRYFSDESNGKLSVSQWNRRRTLFFRSCFCLGILLVLIFFVKAAKAKTIPELSRTILGPLMDPCSTENMEMNPRLLKRSWVWPAITYRRLFNFYTGSEECRPKSQSIAFLDRETEELIVSSRCADQTEPRILLYEPSNTDLAKPEKIDRMDLIPDTPIVYHDILNRVFKNGTDKVRVHRDKSGVLLSVEVNLEKYRALERAAKNPAERAQMEKWPSSKVYAIPLGLTASYLVQCPKKGHEEIFFYPVPADLYGSEDIVQNASFLQNNTNITFSPEKPEPAGSVFTFIFDAVSRQEVARILPKFSQWIQGFKKRQDEKKSGGRGYFVVEPPGYTTIGFSTRHNMDYLFFGKSFEEEKMYHSIYNVVKYKHGVDVSTSMTMGYCHNSIMFGGYDASIPEDSHIGLGSRFFGVDHHFFSPLCHQDFGTVLGNFKGPNSITKRCLAGEHVHNHLLSYMSPLLKQHVILAGGEGTASSKIFPHLKPSAFKSGNKYFMDFAIFTEGHEGTHSVLALLDDDLTQFMKDLEEKIGFFDNPQNTFIFTADHGNHMGPYFEFTTAGQLERTTPAMIIIAHPEMMEKIDVNKGQEIGTSERNFKERMKRLWTNADLYYTLGDIFGVTAELNQVKEMFQEKYAPAKVLPSSLFDDHTVGPLKTCKDYGHNIGEYCLLDFCRPKEE